MDSALRVQTPSGHRAVLITALAVPLTGWTVHALTLHRRLAAERIDPLTGAQRRRVFERRAQRLVHQHPTDSVVCLVDLDHFKDLNDEHGHATGDMALAATGERLAGWAGPRGVVGRLGGDEFAVATRVEPTDGENVLEQRLDQLMGALREPVLTAAGPITIAASVGTAVPAYLGTSALPSLLRGADVSMYRTKHTGNYGWAGIEDLQTATVNGRRAGRPGTHTLARAA
ncbi:GGDEF domain-containing protein [Streptomyces sp. H39-C1]|uniref:GGDEF domain-containing protein n=1 Tax=Streptomyces sp. H39-C1 TaxID=3004355 RepID=UPI0022B058A2|nr:GGDEF domain-containing protein [Streptomyces sp. H39-C1]MCZ4098033.1 GGDEF domain-containing protein [Streptomyces sp. H39-C1]